MGYSILAHKKTTLEYADAQNCREKQKTAVCLRERKKKDMRNIMHFKPLVSMYKYYPAFTSFLLFAI